MALRLEEPRDDETTSARWTRVTEIVGGALERPDARERRRYLHSACDGDRELRREVEALLRFEDVDSAILAGPLLGSRAEAGAIDTDAETPVMPAPAAPAPALEGSAPELGQTIGPYRVERILGAGGMGVVALAYDPELDRRVALKLLRRDGVSDELLRRFETERRVLARLDHPHIARIFDAGTISSGDDDVASQPWFAMELVEGEPIDTWCDDRRLSVNDRLRLVLKVCDALAEAHRNLVVHRDLKPGNILVTRAGEPKILDFGIAKDLDTLTDTTLTRDGQPLTPAYASPEQVRGQPVTVATDVYSLGVLLYRLLCGHPPYLLDGDQVENLRKLCFEEPPPPSARATITLEVWRDGQPVAVTPTTLAQARDSEPAALRRRLRGDLDSIVGTALAKEPAARYRSMEQFAADLRNHLEGRPVDARQATALYRGAKFARRHRWRLAAAAVVAAALIAGVLGWLARNRAIEEQRRVAEQATQAEQQADVLTLFARNLVRAVDPDASGGRRLSAREILERAREQALASFEGEAELLGHQLEALGLAYQSLGDLDAARPLLEESLRLRRSVYSGPGGDPDHRLVARGLNNLAALYYVAGDRDPAERLYREALEMRQRLGQPPEELAKVESNLATLLTFRGEYAEAEALYRRVLDTRRRVWGPDDRDVANSLRSLGNLLYLKGDFEAAESAAREALKLRIVHDGPRSTGAASTLSLLGRVQHARGQLEEAAETLTQALEIRLEILGEDHLHVAFTHKDLASVRFELGDDAAAEELWQQAIRVLRARKPEGCWELADADSQVGGRLAARGQLEEAEPLLRGSYETLRKLRGEASLYARQARERLEAFEAALSPGLAARGKSQAALRAALFRHLCVAKSAKYSSMPVVSRLDMTKNCSLSHSADFHHGLLAREQGSAS